MTLLNCVAQLRLCCFCAGLPEDRNEALKLYEMAAKEGCASSQKALRDLKRNMERPLVKGKRN